MSDVRIYLYSSCSSCRNALAMLQDAGIEPEVHDIFRNRMASEEIGALLNEIDRKPSQVLSSRSTPYRELALADKNLTEDELLALMAEYPALLRRPIIIGGGEQQVGFSKSAVQRLIARVEEEKRS